MSSPENFIRENIDEVNAYFRRQFDINHDGIQVETYARKETIANHLKDIGNATWFGGYPLTRVDIFIAGEDEKLEPRTWGNMKSRIRRFSSADEVRISEEGQRQFSWAVTIFPSMYQNPLTFFADAETSEIGVRRTHDREFTFDFYDGAEGIILADCENHLGTVFYPSSELRKLAKDPSEQYVVLSSSQVPK